MKREMLLSKEKFISMEGITKSENNTNWVWNSKVRRFSNRIYEAI